MNRKVPKDKRKIFSIRRKLTRFDLDALILMDHPSVFYLCGVYFEGAIFLVFRKGDPVFVVDSMNFSLAEKLLKNRSISLVKAEGSKLPVLKRIIGRKKISNIGFSADSISFERYDVLKKALPHAKLHYEKRSIPVSAIMRELREIKDPDEIRILSRAAKETIGIWDEVKRKVKPGMTEIEISVLVDSMIRLKGYKNSFPTIAATGPNSAFPHAVPTNRKLKANDHLLVDFGLVYKGYCSDLTRTLYKGRIDRQIGQFRDLLLDVQMKAIDMISPGVKICDVIKEVNRFFYDNDVSRYVLHGLGHGVGIEVHEAPFLRVDTRKTFKKGMVVTIEPGLYRAGSGGVRQEDMVLVTEKGRKVLTKW